jgi:capsular polysaccharide biosynthesis protein
MGEQLRACQNTAVADYLKSYTRKTENLAQVNTRAGEKPMVYPLAKYVVQNSVLTFIVSLMAAAFVAVLLEYRDGRRPAGMPER